jgi:hypothetical protein
VLPQHQQGHVATLHDRLLERLSKDWFIGALARMHLNVFR